jgi:hypothetical protein
MNEDWTASLTDEQKEQVWKFIVYTVKEIRNDIAMDIIATSDLWKSQGLNKSRRTQKAFDICAAIAWGKHELEHHGLREETSD